MFRIKNTHKLVTHEDPFHIHKTMGTLTLVNYAYRVSTQQFDLNFGTVLMLCIHIAPLHYR